MKNLVRLALTAIFVVTCMISAVVVFAAVQIFDGKGEWHTSDAENQQIAMARASQRAKLDAQKKAGVYLKTFSRSVNLELVDDEISAVTNNIIEIVGDVHFDKKIIQLSNQQTTILYTATLKAKIDPEGIYDFVKRANKANIVQQNTQLQNAIQKNDELSASLTEQYNRATSQAEKDKIRKQMHDADRYFLGYQKVEEALGLYYAKNYNGAIKLYDEVVQLVPDNFVTYSNRGVCYNELKNYEQAIRDFNKAIEINPKFAEVYINRGSAYLGQKHYEQAIKDFDKAIEINPNYAEAYVGHGAAYAMLGNFNQAMVDVTKAIQINPNLAPAYVLRGICYKQRGENVKAQADFAKAKQLGYNG